MLRRLALAAEYRDDVTGQHAQRVGNVSAQIAEAIGLPADQVELIRQAASLHDVGKIGIPDRILMKPGKLSPEEYEEIKTHTVIGARILSDGTSRLLQLAEEIALYHHERWDGYGYAELCGISIPLAARIVTIADVFDVLTHERPYKPAQSLPEARAEIERCKGLQFDPELVDAFLSLNGAADYSEARSPGSKAGAAVSRDLSCTFDIR